MDKYKMFNEGITPESIIIDSQCKSCKSIDCDNCKYNEESALCECPESLKTNKL